MFHLACHEYLQAHYSTGAVSHSFTSTATVPVTENEAAIIDRDALRYAKVKRKGGYEGVCEKYQLYILLLFFRLREATHFSGRAEPGAPL